MSIRRRAVFVDRDGTLIEDTEFVRDPGQVHALLPGAAEAVRRLNEVGLPVVVVTNQSGIARGLLSTYDFEAVQQRLTELLSAEGARVDATYMCPHHPDIDGPCDCRKPGSELYHRAARDLSLDLAASFYVGDRVRDVAVTAEVGGTPLLVGSGPNEPEDVPADITSVSSFADAVDRILESLRGGRGADVAPASLAVFASGSGTNLQALLDTFGSDGHPDPAVRVALVVSDRTGIKALERADAAGVPTRTLSPKGFESAEAWSAALLEALREHRIDLIALAGYLKLVPESVVQAYRGRIVNIHPGPLPTFGGPGMYGQRVHEAVIASGVKISGPTVHFVDERYDTGPIIARWPVPVRAGDDPGALAARVLRFEHRLYPAVIRALALGRIELQDDGTVRAPLGAMGPDEVFEPGDMEASLAGLDRVWCRD